ncbi:1-hydroxy-2-methyl-2-butenyl 4-diphosphate reductase [Streptacidiphilus sp. 4-A2]|nr:1-hydroxy-2-methyl-2-butenyl 4-diphosphate reductase [Streptacidiphilus sp. 4-A2]
MTTAPPDPLLLACALGAERGALRPAGRMPGVRLLRTGMVRSGPDAPSAGNWRGGVRPRAFLFAGFGAAVGPGIRPGEIVVATQVRDTLGEPVQLPGAGRLADALSHTGMTVRSGPLYTADRIVRGAERAALHADGVLCVDMETSAALRELPEGVPAAAVRVIVDTPEQELLRPGTLVHGLRAWRILRAAAPVLAAWRP